MRYLYLKNNKKYTESTLTKSGLLTTDVDVVKLLPLPTLIPFIKFEPIGEFYKVFDGVYAEKCNEVPMTDEEKDEFIKELKDNKIRDVKINFISNTPVEIDGVVYNGGDGSASAINGTIQLAQELGEVSVKIWDIDNVIREYTFEEAINISAKIAKAYRDVMFERQELITAINKCTTLEELYTIEVNHGRIIS